MKRDRKELETQGPKLSNDEVQKTVCALLKLVEVTNKKSEILSQQEKINLQITMKKIPNMPNKTIKINLPHGLQTPDRDVCLFVKDLDSKSREFEISEDHFRDLLIDKGVNCISKVIPIKALKLEYKPYEAKKNLSNEFDVFLADERIVRLLPSLLGKNFYGRKKNPIQVNLSSKNLKQEISKAVNNSRCMISARGASCMATVGHTKMSVNNLVENIVNSLEQIAAGFPGGGINIRSLHIKSETSMSLPIYVSLESADVVELPVTKKVKRQPIVDEITTVSAGQVKVTSDGQVKIVHKKKMTGNKTEQKVTETAVAVKDEKEDGQVDVKCESQNEQEVTNKQQNKKSKATKRRKIKENVTQQKCDSHGEEKVIDSLQNSKSKSTTKGKMKENTTQQKNDSQSIEKKIDTPQNSETKSTNKRKIKENVAQQDSETKSLQRRKIKEKGTEKDEKCNSSNKGNEITKTSKKELNKLEKKSVHKVTSSKVLKSKAQQKGKSRMKKKLI